MGFITDVNTFRRHQARIDQLVDLRKRLPDQVFRKPFHIFTLMDCDEVFWGKTMDILKTFVQSFGEDLYFLGVVDPNPVTYYKLHFNIYPILKVGESQTVLSYRQALQNPLTQDNPETVADAATIAVIYSFHSEWIIYCDREFELAVAGFSNEKVARLFMELHPADRLFTPQEAISELLDVVYVNGVPKDIQKRLKENYWTHLSFA